MASRALPDLVARIRVDSSGVDAAMSNLVGSFGKANFALAGVAVGIGLVIAGGESMIKISEKHDAAMRGLSQAYSAAGVNLSGYQRNIDDFIMSNKRYISDQSEVIDGYAKLTRSGLSQTEVQRAMNDAVDLAALKNISLTDAVGLLDNAEHGRMRGLIDLGITTGKYTDAQGNLIQSSHSVAKAMDELDQKVKGGRQSLTDIQQNSNELKQNWETLAKQTGPALVGAENDLVAYALLFGEAWNKIAHDDKLWATISARLVGIADQIKRFTDWLNAPHVIGGLVLTNPQGAGPGNANPLGRATGGPVLPGGIYTVGENGPETLMMGPRGGGMVIPGGTTHYNLTLNGSSAVNDPEGVRRMLQRMSLLGAAS